VSSVGAWSMPSSFGTRPDSARIKTAVEAAFGGDRKALVELRGLLTAADWKNAGDVAEQVIGNAIESLTNGNALLDEAVGRNLAALETELLGEHSGPIERLLVARVLVAWIQAHEADRAYYNWRDKHGGASAGAFSLRRQESTQRRLLAALRALATVRGLIPGALQVNLTSGPQLNLCGKAK
jgi:hypothetical protein